MYTLRRFFCSGRVWMAGLAVCMGSLTAFAEAPPLAHWAFEEEDAAVQYADSAPGHAFSAVSADPIPHRRGVFGQAIALGGAHRIEAKPFHRDTLPAISITAWVRPGQNDGYREILRAECDERVLFSFQESGSILALGLNINGYLECDGHLGSLQVDDGGWHFCAAVFDGHFMRVYVDAQEIGRIDREGEIRVCPEAPIFIGSTNGQNEHFQGALDEVFLYDTALSPEVIADSYHKGVTALAETSKELDGAVNRIYVRGADFAETLVQTRMRLALQSSVMNPDVVEGCLNRMRADFPEEYKRLATYIDAAPSEWLISTDESIFRKPLAYLVDLMMECRPLTEGQKERRAAAEAAQWAAADNIAAQFNALAEDPKAPHVSPEWIRLILKAGARVQERPRVHEPVAPYIKPETPETRALTPEEARKALEEDWLYQVDQQPTPDRIRQEIAWTRELADRIPGDLSAEKAQLATLDQEAAGLGDSDAALYFRVREVKRAIMFRNPVLDFDRLLLVDMPYPQGSEWRHETRHRLGYMAVPGARLLLVEGLNPDAGVTKLMPQAPLHGAFWRPDLSFDGKKVLFCFKPHNEKSFHLYEMNLDGTGLVQLTDGIYDDIDPVYMPDGHILFTTTRGHNYVRCMPPTNSFELARADGDGKNIYIISYSNEPDYLPSVMEDGRVIYTRWEYTDKPLWRAQKLWTTHPDGTQVVTFWGNQSVWPDVMKDARNIPGSRRVMFTGSAHHDWFAGSVGIIDPDKGINFPDGLTKVTADVEWPECHNGPVDPVESARYHNAGKYAAYYSPYPLSERDFLVSAQRDGKFRLYLMDIDGNRELVYEGVHHIFHAMPVKARVTPPALADGVAWPEAADREHPKKGVIYSNNVYQNAPPELKGKARYLRIFQIDPKTYTYWYKRPYISTGPVVSAVQSEGVKRLIGVVPVEEDGSVSFEAPPGQALHFQLLDENYRALQTMRSFVGVMPGEKRGCLGCHESHSRTPALTREYGTALRKAPQSITPPPWKDTTVSYARYVRPVLDKYCSKCHEGEGKGRKVFDMTERPAPPTFSEPYLTLIGRPSWGAPYAPPEKPAPGFGFAGVFMVEAYGQIDPKAYKTPPPMTSLSYKSPLIERAASGKHHGVKVDSESLLRLITWVDAMCPYLGDEEVRAIPDPEFQGIDWLAIRPLIKNAPVIPRPGPVD